MKLKKIEIRNWLTIRESAIEFPERGIILVRGNNIASGGKMRSVGSGKTALGEAISRTLFGVKGRYTDLGHYSFDGKGNTYVKVTTELQSKALDVELGFKCAELSKTGEGLRFTLDGQQVWRDHIRATREELCKVVGITPELAAWTVYIDGDNLKFNDLSQKGSIDILMSALAQPSWTEFHRRASDTASNFKHDLAKDASANDEAKNNAAESKTELELAQHSLARERQSFEKESAEWKASIKEIDADIERENVILDQTDADLRKIKSEIKALESKDAELAHQVEIQKHTVQDALDEKQRLQETRLVELGKLESSADRVRQDIEKMASVPKNCPKCGKPWDVQHSAAELAALKKKESELDTKTAGAQKITDGLALDITKLKGHILKLDQELRSINQQSPIKALSQKYERLAQVQRATESKLASLERERTKSAPDSSKVAEAASIVQERERQLMKNDKRVLETAARLQETTEAHAVVAYWQNAFGPTGIPNMILREAIQPLNDTARRLSNLMTGGTIKIVYDTKRELTSGAEKAELIVRVENKLGAKRLEGNSKGEGGISNLVIAETLSEVGCVSGRIGYRWYDELIALNQDDVVRHSILSYLKEAAHRLGILIFIVCHHEDVANYCDYILVAEKNNDGTSFYWD